MCWVWIGLIMGLIAQTSHGEHARTLQALQLAHEAAFAYLSPAGNFIGVEALIRLTEQQAQGTLLSGSEQSIAEREIVHGSI